MISVAPWSPFCPGGPCTSMTSRKHILNMWCRKRENTEFHPSSTDWLILKSWVFEMKRSVELELNEGSLTEFDHRASFPKAAEVGLLPPGGSQTFTTLIISASSVHVMGNWSFESFSACSMKKSVKNEIRAFILVNITAYPRADESQVSFVSSLPLMWENKHNYLLIISKQHYNNYR